MKLWHQKLFILLLLAASSASCKRTELELTDTSALIVPGTGDIISARSIEEERSANLKRQSDLDQAIQGLKDSLANSKNLSAEQRAELEQKISAAEQEKTSLSRREKELADKLAETQKALDEARKRNEELKRELEKAKEQAKIDAPEGQDPGKSKVAPLGPFILFKGDQCLEVEGKSTADNAKLTMGLCTSETHQTYTFDLADESGAYRINPQNSQKCLAVDKGSIELNAKLIQTTCNLTDLAQQFYILGINDNDFLLQSVKSQYCFNIQPDKSMAQVVCDTKLESTFRINNPTR